MFTRLIYSSQASRIIGPEDINSILISANRYNSANNITGMLCHNNQLFLQYIEGAEIYIDRLYDQIARDDRHKNIRILHRSSGEFRRFTSWSMGFVKTYDPRMIAMLQEKTGINIFQIEHLTPAQAINIIANMKDLLELQGVINISKLSS